MSTDIKTIFELIKPRRLIPDQEERLKDRYKDQAEHYDSFRERLLLGRAELISEVVPKGFSGTWVDLGGGTGSNISKALENLGDAKVYLVDMCEPLLEIAKSKLPSFIKKIKADATGFSLDEKVDLVTFSYSLTMIPDWIRAIDNAFNLLKVGGKIGVVDFFISRKYPSIGPKHSWLERTFWPIWFGYDDVFLSGDHFHYLSGKFEVLSIEFKKSSVPYLPFIRVPFYKFLGQKT